jgi:hypothetical protein
MLEGTDIDDNAFHAFAYVYQRIVGLTAGPLEGVFNQDDAAGFGICGYICFIPVIFEMLVVWNGT